MRTRAGLLDTITILAGGAALALFVLWLAATVVGLPILEQLPIWLRNSAGAAWALLTGGSIGTGYMKRRLQPAQNSPNFVVAIPVAAAVILGSTIGLGYWLQSLDPAELPTVAAGPAIADLSFDLVLEGQTEPLVDHGAAPILSFAQQSPIQAPATRVALQDRGFYVRHGIDLPNVGTNYAAYFTRRPEESRHDPAVPPQEFFTPVCFKYVKAVNARRKLHLHCEERSHCDVAEESREQIAPCGGGTATRARWRWASPGIVGVAQAQPRATESGDEPGWRAPSLATLQNTPSVERTGFTHFHLESEPIPAARGAEGIRFDVWANGTPVYFDGWPSSYQPPRPFDPATGLSLDFALENLNFSGRDAGYDLIEVRLSFFASTGQPVEAPGTHSPWQVRCRRSYIALRPAPPEQRCSIAGTPVRWSGTYERGKRENRFEVMLLSSKRGAAMIDEHRRLVAKFERIGVSDYVPVLRPPLPPNENWGLTMGMVHGSGQVQFTFNAEEAARACRKVLALREPIPAIRDDTYRYEIDTQGVKRCDQIR